MVKSKLGDLPIPEVPLHFVVFSQFDNYGDRDAMVNGITGERFTYRQVKQLCGYISASLRKIGVKQGDVLAICLPNCPEFVLMVYGAMALGATVTTVNPMYTLYEMTKQMEDSRARHIFFPENLAGKIQKLREKCTFIQNSIVLGQSAGCVPFSSLLIKDQQAFDPMEVNFNPKEDVVFLPYSSGTTGMPKGVMLTHYNLVAHIMHFLHPQIAVSRESSTVPVVLAYLPLFHVAGLSVHVCLCLAGGMTIVTLPTFTPETFLGAIEKFKVTHLTLVPPTVLFLARSPLTKKYDLSSVQSVGSGTAPLSKGLEEELQKKYNLEMGRAYGMSEAPVATFRPDTMDEKKRGTVGILLPNTEIQVVDVDTKRVVGPNEKGELWIRGPQVMKGYLNKPEMSRAALDEQGWLHTGDIGYYDRDEYFYVVDRIKELIKYKGFQVPPAEIEGLLLTHPAVADVGVTGIPDPAGGEVPKAYVVKRHESSVSEKDLLAYVKENLTSYKQLRGGVEFVKQIPKTETGKILRRKLKEMATTGSKL